MASKNKKKLTEGSIIKSLLRLAIPLILGQMLQATYQLTDTFWVGRLGPDSIAAVSISFPINFLLISVGGGLSIAGTILIAQYKGKSNTKVINFIAAQTIIMVFIMSIITSILGYILSIPILSLMNVEPSVFNDALDYLRISFIGIIFQFGFFMYKSLMRGVGDVKTPLFIAIGSVLLNFVLDPLLIFGYGFVPGFGVRGAALATIGTQGLATLIALLTLFSGNYGIQLKLNNLMPDYVTISKLFKIGFPSSIEQSTRALGLMLMTLLVANLGTNAVAAYGVGTRVLNLVIISALGISMATSTLVGQHIGAKKTSRITKIIRTSAISSFLLLAFIGFFTYTLSGHIARFFVPTEHEIAEMGSQFIKYISFAFGFMGLHQVLNGVYTGSGNTLMTMVFSLISHWVLKFPLAYIFSEHLGFEEQGIWGAVMASNIFVALISLAYFSRGDWKHKEITEEMRISDRVITESKIAEGIRP